MSDTRIAGLQGRRVWDSRGRPTVEAEVRLIGGAVGRAIAPAGASTGSGEAIELRDGGTRLSGRDVRHAVAAVNGEIAAALTGQDATDQAAIDRLLIELDGTPQKKRLGGNALVAVSMAALHAAANAVGRPLYAYLLGEQTEAVMPLPELQILGGGAHAGRRGDIQDCMILARHARGAGQGLEWTSGAYRGAGAAVAGRGRLQGAARAVVGAEQSVGDNCSVTNAKGVKQAAALGICNAVLMKRNQAGAVSEAKAALDEARAAGWGAIVSARSGETEDVTIVHLAIGWGVGQLKVGSFARSERMAKWNECLRIEGALGSRARFAGRAPLNLGSQ